MDADNFIQSRTQLRERRTAFVGQQGQARLRVSCLQLCQGREQQRYIPEAHEANRKDVLVRMDVHWAVRHGKILREFGLRLSVVSWRVVSCLIYLFRSPTDPTARSEQLVSETSELHSSQQPTHNGHSRESWFTARCFV